MNLCYASIVAAALAALGVIANIMRLRAQGVRLTLPVQRHNGHKHPEALYETEVEELN